MKQIGTVKPVKKLAGSILIVILAFGYGASISTASPFHGKKPRKQSKILRKKQLTYRETEKLHKSTQKAAQQHDVDMRRREYQLMQASQQRGMQQMQRQQQEQGQQ